MKVNQMTRMVAALALTLAATVAEAAPGGSSTMSVREEKRFGANLAVGRPFPQIMGLNASYNVNNDLRVNLGQGSMEVTTGLEFTDTGFATRSSKLSTIGLGADYFFTDWGFRPTLGLSISHNTYEGEAGSLSVNGVSESGTLLVGAAGFDYQSQGGFNFQTGIQQALAGNTTAGNFYLAGGWFF